MVTVRFLVIVVVLVGACMFSFNYVKGHESTAQKEQIADLEQHIELLSSLKQKVIRAKDDVEGRLKQACGLLAAADVDNDLCEIDEPDVVDASDLVDEPDVAQSEKVDG